MFTASAVGALEGLSSGRVRAVLVVVSIALGVCALTGVQTAGSSVAAAITERALLSGGPSQTYFVDSGTGHVAAVTTGYLQRSGAHWWAAEKLSVEETVQNLQVTAGGKGITANVLFTDRGFRAIRPLPVLQGHWLDATPRIVAEVVVNNSAAQSGLALGATGQLSTGDQSPLSFQVTGVADDGNTSPNIYADTTAAGTWLTARSPEVDSGLLISAPDLTQGTLQHRLSDAASLAGITDDFSVTRTDTIGTLASTLDATRRAFLIVALLCFVIAVVGVANIGWSSAGQRSVEFSIRRALGATAAEIGLMVTFESLTLGFLGGLLAVPGSVVLSQMIVPAFSGTLTFHPGPFDLTIVPVSIGLGVLAVLIGSIAAVIRSIRISIGDLSRD